MARQDAPKSRLLSSNETSRPPPHLHPSLALGLVFCLIFLAWFASGIVLIYHRMPESSTDERLARLAPLELDDVRISPKEAYDAAGLTEMPQRAYIT